MSESNYMDIEPLADAGKYCMNCKYIEGFEEGEVQLGDIRRRCTRCKKSDSRGIYKADAIITALRLKKADEKSRIKTPYRGGRVSKIPASVRKAIKEQHNNGKSIRAIAKDVGYNKNTVNKILKNFKE